MSERLKLKRVDMVRYAGLLIRPFDGPGDTKTIVVNLGEAKRRLVFECGKQFLHTLPRHRICDGPSLPHLCVFNVPRWDFLLWPGIWHDDDASTQADLCGAQFRFIRANGDYDGGERAFANDAFELSMDGLGLSEWDENRAELAVRLARGWFRDAEWNEVFRKRAAAHLGWPENLGFGFDDEGSPVEIPDWAFDANSPSALSAQKADE